MSLMYWNCKFNNRTKILKKILYIIGWNLPMDISIKTLPESAKVKLDWFPIRCNIPLVGKLLILYQLKLCNDHDCTSMYSLEI